MVGAFPPLASGLGSRPTTFQLRALRCRDKISLPKLSLLLLDDVPATMSRPQSLRPFQESQQNGLRFGAETGSKRVAGNADGLVASTVVDEVIRVSPGTYCRLSIIYYLRGAVVKMGDWPGAVKVTVELPLQDPRKLRICASLVQILKHQRRRSLYAGMMSCRG